MTESLDSVPVLLDSKIESLDSVQVLSGSSLVARGTVGDRLQFLWHVWFRTDDSRFPQPLLPVSLAVVLILKTQPAAEALWQGGKCASAGPGQPLHRLLVQAAKILFELRQSLKLRRPGRFNLFELKF